MDTQGLKGAYVGMMTAFCAAVLSCSLCVHRAKAADVPRFEVDPSWPKLFPKLWVTGDVAGTCIDAQDHVFIVNRNNLTPDEQKNSHPSPPVMEFDPEGNVVNSWGDRKILPSGSLHGCTVDGEGNVWLGGSGDGIIQKYTHDGSKLLLQIGTRGQLDTSNGKPNGNAMNSSHTMMNKPACIAIDPANGDIYVSDGYGNKRVVVFDKEGHFLRQWGQQGTVTQTEAGVGGVFLDTVHCVAIDNAGLVYVCDRKGDRVEVFDKMGTFKKNIYIKKGTGYIRDLAGSAWWVAFSRDPGQKYMYVSDGGNEVVWTLDHSTGEILSGFGQPGHQVGNFSFLHTIAIDSQGNLIAGETINGRRVQKFKLAGSQPSGSMPSIREDSAAPPEANAQRPPD
jgi:DNA-binding beta-propeller fold protein YncE